MYKNIKILLLHKMGASLSLCKIKNKNENKNNYKNENQKMIQTDPAIDMVDQDGKTYLQYIMNYDSIPYFIPQIKYAKVTDIRLNYTIVVAARFPNNDSPIHRFPVRLKYVDNANNEFNVTPGFESNLHYKAMDALFPLICSTIVELRDVENCGGMLYADVYYGKVTSVSEWLVDRNLAVDVDGRYKLVKPVHTMSGFM